uniref:BTB domain-containing protein n=1 Tax=Caenorhabditis tropicalis TaxID=1561998 RepID=A0A1I7T2S9_9PELO
MEDFRQVTVYQPTEPKHEIHLFKQPGYVLCEEHRLKMGPYTWVIKPYKYERRGQYVVDIIINVHGVEPGFYLSTEFSLQQPGNVKHTFEHAFDCHRTSFFFRRAMTIPITIDKDGKQKLHHSHYRFLRCRDDDEPPVTDEVDNWKGVIPLEWDFDGEFPMPYDNNDHFLNDLYLLEEYKSTFIYYFTVEHAQRCNYMPARPMLIWPKANRTARYLQGKQIAVDESWFYRWPGFRLFMLNVDLLTPDDFEEFIDVLGAYYHSWCFDHHRIQELVRVAEKFGFYDFAENYLYAGDVDVYFSSMRSCLISPPNHHYLKNNFNPPDQYISKYVHSQNFSFTARTIWPDLIAPFFLTFKTQNKLEWTVNLCRKCYAGKEYLYASFMLNGESERDENQLWKIEFGPSKQSSTGKLPRREHSRVLNRVQRTICFPTCWPWADVVKEMGMNGPFMFSFKAQYSSLTGWKWDAVAGNEPATGVKNGQLSCGKHTHLVNMELLQEYCGNLRNWVGIPGKPNKIEMDLDPSDVMHFLDHLYHSSKFYTMEQWQKILKVAQAMDCERVVDQFERALIRTEAQKCTDKNFNENYSLDFLRVGYGSF